MKHKVIPLPVQSPGRVRYQDCNFQHFSENAARSAGLEPQQTSAMLAVKGYAGEGQGLSIGYLAERLKLRHHSTVELVIAWKGA